MIDILMKKGRRCTLADKKMITQAEIDNLMYQLSKIRDSANLPTEEEVVEMLIRMKERWRMA